MIDFFHAPGACSLGIHVILEEIGVDYRLHLLDLKSGQQRTDTYRSMNPKGKVPAIRLEQGEVLTEFQTIAFWLAESHPEAGLLPEDRLARARVMEALDYMVASVHMRGFTLVLAPMKFVSDPAAQEALRAHGLTAAIEGLAQLSETMGTHDWLLGEYSIADAALFYLTVWADRIGVEMPANIAAIHARMTQRPAVARALNMAATTG